MAAALQRFLFGAYDGADFVLAQKAKVLMGMYLTVLVVAVFCLITQGSRDVAVLHAIGAGVVVNCALIEILRRGYFVFASNLLVAVLISVVYVVMFTEHGTIVERFDTIVVIMGALAVVPIAVIRRRLALVAYFAYAMALFALFLYRESGKLDVPAFILSEYAGDTLMGFALLSVASYNSFTINARAMAHARSSIALAEAEAAKNRELNRTLEWRVTERTKEVQMAMDQVAQTNRELVSARDALWGEMELAKRIQTALLPPAPTLEGYSIAATMVPAKEVGGDYYDIIPGSDGGGWVLIGDVSGHGVSSGLVMMMAQTAIRVMVANDPSLAPSELLQRINGTLVCNIAQLGESKYVTLTALRSRGEGRFTFAGLHQDILIYRHATREVEVVTTNGVWVGMLDSVAEMNADAELQLDVGDTMLLFTDGITEAWRKGAKPGERRPERDMFGDARLRRILEGLGELPPTAIRDGIQQELEGFDCADDVTMVVVRRLPP